MEIPENPEENTHQVQVSNDKTSGKRLFSVLKVGYFYFLIPPIPKLKNVQSFCTKCPKKPSYHQYSVVEVCTSDCIKKTNGLD